MVNITYDTRMVYILCSAAHINIDFCLYFTKVAYQNDPESALIQFASPDEAKRAMQSTEAVLNNRFIRVHWYRYDESAQLQPQTQPAMVKVHFKGLLLNI